MPVSECSDFFDPPAPPAGWTMPSNYVVKRCWICRKMSTSPSPLREVIWTVPDVAVWVPLFPWGDGKRGTPIGLVCKVFTSGGWQIDVQGMFLRQHDAFICLKNSDPNIRIRNADQLGPRTVAYVEVFGQPTMDVELLEYNGATIAGEQFDAGTDGFHRKMYSSCAKKSLSITTGPVARHGLASVSRPSVHSTAAASSSSGATPPGAHAASAAAPSSSDACGEPEAEMDGLTKFWNTFRVGGSVEVSTASAAKARAAPVVAASKNKKKREASEATVASNAAVPASFDLEDAKRARLARPMDAESSKPSGNMQDVDDRWYAETWLKLGRMTQLDLQGDESVANDVMRDIIKSFADLRSEIQKKKKAAMLRRTTSNDEFKSLVEELDKHVAESVLVLKALAAPQCPGALITQVSDAITTGGWKFPEVLLSKCVKGIFHDDLKWSRWSDLLDVSRVLAVSLLGRQKAHAALRLALGQFVQKLLKSIPLAKVLASLQSLADTMATKLTCNEFELEQANFECLRLKVLSAIANCEAACSDQSDDACILASSVGLPVGKKLLELGRAAATGRRSALAYLDTLDVQVSCMTDIFVTDENDALLESGEFRCSSQGVVTKLAAGNTADTGVKLHIEFVSLVNAGLASIVQSHVQNELCAFLIHVAESLNETGTMAEPCSWAVRMLEKIVSSSTASSPAGSPAIRFDDLNLVLSFHTMLSSTANCVFGMKQGINSADVAARMRNALEDAAMQIQTKFPVTATPVSALGTAVSQLVVAMLNTEMNDIMTKYGAMTVRVLDNSATLAASPTDVLDRMTAMYQRIKLLSTGLQAARQLTHALSDHQVMENIPDKSHIAEAKVAAFHTCVLKDLATTGDGQWWAQVPTLQAGVAKLVDLALNGLDSAKTVYMLQVKTTTDAMATSLALPDFNGGEDIEQAMKEFIATHDMATIKKTHDGRGRAFYGKGEGNRPVDESEPEQASVLVLHAMSSKEPMSSTSEQGVVFQPQDAVLARRDDQLPDEQAMTSSPGTTLMNQAGMASAQHNSTVDAVDLRHSQVSQDLEKELEELLDAESDGAAEGGTFPTDTATTSKAFMDSGVEAHDEDSSNLFGEDELLASADGNGGDDDVVGSLQGAREFVAMFGGSKEDFLARLDADPNGMGYCVKTYILDAESYYLPQFRTRLYLVGIRRNVPHMCRSPEDVQRRAAAKTKADTPSEDQSGKKWVALHMDMADKRGLHFPPELLDNFSESLLGDLSGNAFSAVCCMAIVMAITVSLEFDTENDMQEEEAADRIEDSVSCSADGKMDDASPQLVAVDEVMARKGAIAVTGRYFLDRQLSEDYTIANKVLGSGMSGPVQLATGK
ncbi:unnamed protein product, partial [Polarella glacialis]